MSTDDGHTTVPTFLMQQLPAETSGRWWKRAAHMRIRREPELTRPDAAIGAAPAHWGELVQGWVRHGNKIEVGLVTLPDRTYSTTVVATPHGGSGIFCAQPGKWKAISAGCRTLHELDRTTGLWLHIESTIPTGVGGGSSTSDCTATARAVNVMLRMIDPAVRELNDLEILQKIVFPAESACDPLAILHWGLPILWGSRCGKVLGSYQHSLPPLHALGFVTDPAGVSTDELAAEQRTMKPSESDLDAFAAVLKKFEEALVRRSARGVAEAAEESGTLNQKLCPIGPWKELRHVARKVRALGVSCSHSGTAAAFLWRAGTENVEKRIEQARQELEKLHITEHVHEFFV